MADIINGYTKDSLFEFGTAVQRLVITKELLKEFQDITSHFWNTEYDEFSKHDGTMTLLNKVPCIFDLKAISTPYGLFQNGNQKRTFTMSKTQYEFMIAHPKTSFILAFWVPSNELLLINLEECLRLEQQKLNESGVVKLGVPGHAVWGCVKGRLTDEEIHELLSILK